MLESLADSLQWVAVQPAALKFALVFLFMAVESSFIPFPSEVVMIPAGFMAARLELGLAPLPALVASILLGIAGSLAGAYANYYLSARLGKPFLLKYGRYSISEISDMVGFNTPSYFATCFKKYMGCLPTEYVKKNA